MSASTTAVQPSGTEPDTPSEVIVTDAPETPEEALELITTTLAALWEGFVKNLPLVGIALVVVVLGVVIAGWAAKTTTRTMKRTRSDAMVVSLVARLVRIAVVVAFILLALSVAGVSVSAALASLGIAGLALAFALQNILENFVSGMLLLIRKPFRAGDQIRVNDLEGTVEEIDLRVTKLVDYDGELVLIPNADVFRSTILNRTRRGYRRTRVAIGIDYRDDHDAAGPLLLEAVRGIEGVRENPPPEVICTGLGDSSVDFEIRYWTNPTQAEVLQVQDRVVRAAKTAVEGAGMTIPWPIRTLAWDSELTVARESSRVD